MMQRVFITVGTTEFDELVRVVSSNEILHTLKQLSFQELILQIGRGSVEPECGLRCGVNVTSFRFKDSLHDDMANADLIISHAGAGTCLETLELKKPLIVVINESLMNNHQIELAVQLAEDGHLLYCTPETLSPTLRSFPNANLKPWKKESPEPFANWLNSYLGLQ